MLVELMCLNCKKIIEELFPSYIKMVEAVVSHSISCSDCGCNEMRRLIGGQHIGMSEVPGYEKRNKGKMTLGKMFDQYKSKWV